METASGSQNATGWLGCPRASKWIWDPWYAKFWWFAIPCWWLGMAGSAYLEILAQFYSTALAGFLHVFFFPPVAFMLLGVGFFRAWLEKLTASANESRLIDDEEPLPLRCFGDQHLDVTEGWRARGNPMDSRSGPLWIGNRDNPSNPSYVSPRPLNPPGH